MNVDDRNSFVAFAFEIEPALRIALVAGYGVERGREAASDALVYGWLHWERVRVMKNPAGYLFRVGQRKASLGRRRIPSASAESGRSDPPWVEPRLSEALAKLSKRQRQAVVLVESYQWTHAEVAELLGLHVATVQTHLRRGLAKLRSELGVKHHG